MVQSTRLTALALLLAACTSSPTAMQSITGEWSVAELSGADIAALDSQRCPALTISGDEVRGFAGVNRFSAKLDEERLKRGEFVTGPAIATRMAGPPAAMAAEQQFLALLEAGCRIEIRDKEFVLLAADGSARARFVRN